MQTSSDRPCTRCGATLHSNFVGRICPRCLLASLAPDTASASFEAPPEEEAPPPDRANGNGSVEWGIGTQLGDYQLVDLLGRGGMAVVYLARQISLDRLVALKTMAAPLAADTRSQERFRREARAVAQLDHPGIVAVHDAGVLGGALFYTMDYVEGQDLHRVLRERSLPLRETVDLLRRVAEAVGYAHASGIVHRDLKPGNILIDAAGQPHVADFGLAFDAEGAGGGLTLTGDMLGTPPYMAPEMLAGGPERATPRTDVYALGAMLFQMLTGRTPFIGSSPSEILQLALHEQPPSLRLLNPAVPRDLETICLKCLEKTPTNRYQTALDFGEDLQRFLRGEPIQARPVSRLGQFSRWCRRKPALAAVWFLIVAIALGFAAATFRIRHEQLRAESSLALTKTAEAKAREHLRSARLAEARAIRRTTIPGRRQQALAALAEAAQVRPGADLRDEALAALMLFDVTTVSQWHMAPGPIRMSLDPAGAVAATETIGDAVGAMRDPVTLRKWGAPDSYEKLSVPDKGPVGSVRFSADGKYLMESFADGTLRVWRTGETAPFLSLPLQARRGGGRFAMVYNDHYAITADDRFIAVGLSGPGVALLRLSDGGEAARWEGGDVFDTIVASPDGRYLAAESLDESRPQRAVTVLSVPGLKPVWTLTPASPPGLLAWSGDSRILTVGQNDGSFTLYDVRDGRPTSKIADAQRRSTAVKPLGGDALLAVTTTNSMHMLNVALAREELFFNGVTRTPLTAAPGDDRLFSMAFNDGTVGRMKVETPLGFVTIPPSRVDGYEVMGNTFSIDFSADGRWIASANRNLLVIFDAHTGRLACDLDTGVRVPDDLGSVVFSADGRYLYRCSTGAAFTRYAITDLPDGGIALGAGESIDAEAGFFIADHAADRQRLVLLNPNTNTVRVVAVGADGKLQTVAQWATPGVYNAAFSPDGSQLLVNASGQGSDHAAQRLRVHRVSDGAVIRELNAPVSCDAAWSAVGHTAMTSNGPLDTLLWDTSDWHVRAKLTGELGGNATTYAIAPDGSYAVITHDDRIHLVSTADGTLLGTFESPGATGLAAGVRFLPGGKQFAILWRDGRIDLVDPGALRAGLAKIGLAW